MFDYYDIEATIELGPYDEQYEVHFHCHLGDRARDLGHPDFREPATAPDLKVTAIYNYKFDIVDKVDCVEFYEQASEILLSKIYDGDFDYLREK